MVSRKYTENNHLCEKLESLTFNLIRHRLSPI